MNHSKIGLITYQHNHLKTAQVLEGLLQKHPNSAISLFALPFVPRPKRPVLLEHRPEQEAGLHPADLARQYKLSYTPLQNDADLPGGCDIYIITGAGILSPACVEGKKILNGHSGIIPLSRGLDSFKWAVYHRQPVGNTLHFIDCEVDKGDIVSVIPTPVYPSDTLETFAARHYALEIDMLIHFEEHLSHPQNPFAGCPAGSATRRMPMETEEALWEKFEEYKCSDQWVVDSD